MLLNIYRQCQNNVGDKMCCPADYFDLGQVRADISGIQSTDLEGFDNCIIGGGGLSVFAEAMEVIRPFAHKMIGWGLGCNRKLTRHRQQIDTTHDIPRFWGEFKLLGVRNFGTAYEWCPCVSCMHPIFDQKFEITHEIGCYEHWQIPMTRKNDRVMRNDQPFEQVIEFLASHEYIATNCYHGAYWATLLGKKVLAHAENSKMFYFKHKPHIYGGNWMGQTGKARVYPEALNECRAVNRAFYEKVMNLL